MFLLGIARCRTLGGRIAVGPARVRRSAVWASDPLLLAFTCTRRLFFYMITHAERVGARETESRSTPEHAKDPVHAKGPEPDPVHTKDPRAPRNAKKAPELGIGDLGGRRTPGVYAHVKDPVGPRAASADPSTPQSSKKNFLFCVGRHRSQRRTTHLTRHYCLCVLYKAVRNVSLDPPAWPLTLRARR